MGRNSKREERRAEIIQAFAKVLANHGFAGATMTAIADTAGLTPGLLHHHFSNKQEMLDELLSHLVRLFKLRLESHRPGSQVPILDYIDCALKLDQSADAIAAKCWVGILAEALREPALFHRVRRHLENEITEVQRLSNGKLSAEQASAVIAYIFWALVFGAFAPKKTSGFAAKIGKVLVAELTK